MYTSGSNLNISVENIPELKALLADALEKGDQLRKALNALAQYELTVSFSTTDNSSGRN